MVVVVKICKKEVYNSETLQKEDNFNRRTVINMFKHISNGTNLRFLLFIQSVGRNFKIYSHILFLDSYPVVIWERGDFRAGVVLG